MYKNRQEIAEILLKKYFNDSSLAVAQVEIVTTLIEKEMNPAIVVFLKTLCAIYEDKLSVSETNEFFYKLSQSTAFKKIFEDIWDEVFVGLDELEKSVLIDQITAQPIYRPVVISNTGNTYDYSTLLFYRKDQSSLTDPETKTEVKNMVIPNRLAYKQIMEWYEQRGLQLIWEDKAKQAGSRAWVSILPGMSVHSTINHSVPYQAPSAIVMTAQTNTDNLAPSKYTGHSPFRPSFFPLSQGNIAVPHMKGPGPFALPCYPSYVAPTMSSSNEPKKYIPALYPALPRGASESISMLKDVHAREKAAIIQL